MSSLCSASLARHPPRKNFLESPVNRPHFRYPVIRYALSRPALVALLSRSTTAEVFNYDCIRCCVGCVVESGFSAVQIAVLLLVCKLFTNTMKGAGGARCEMSGGRVVRVRCCTDQPSSITSRFAHLPHRVSHDRCYVSFPVRCFVG